jgi:hypothetical protein
MTFSDMSDRFSSDFYTRARIEDLVLDEGMLLHPLNTTIPQRDAWRAFACPRCGGRYYRDGKFHTVQAGWQ